MKHLVSRLTGVFLFGFIAVVIGVFIWVAAGEKGQESTDQSGNQAPAQTTNNSSTINTYAASEVATHSTKSDCWTSYNGKVYDITKYFGLHPAGNSTLLEMCGVDSSSIFNSSHYHSSYATSLFLNYYIGDLTN